MTTFGPTGDDGDLSRYRALASDSRASILRFVRAATGGTTAGEVAAHTGQHLSTTRVHLERLVDAGILVKARSSGGQPGRPAWRYREASADPAPAPYRALTAALLDHLPRGRSGSRDTAVRVGRDWGRQLARAVEPGSEPADMVVAVLDGLGFDAERCGSEIHLRTCPFLDLVGRNPEAMCGLHAGVVRGVLEHGGLTGDKPTLEPFGAPGACVVRL